MIPSIAHFIWLGPGFPWLNALALVSASRAGEFEEVLLHCDTDLSSTPYWSVLQRLPGFSAPRVDIPAMARATGFDPAAVQVLYDGQPGPSQRKDLIRALLLIQQGGVYMDLDTVTVRSLANLRQQAGAFCGQERICFPGWSAGSKPISQQARAYGLTVL